jgi:hypothetical protein
LRNGTHILRPYAAFPNSIRVHAGGLWGDWHLPLKSRGGALQGRKGSQEDVKKSIQSVILSAAKNLQLFVFKKLTADASLLLSMTAYFFTPS